MKLVTLTANASGAARAAREGQVVMVVDVIDMSTTLEAALDAGALAVLGASPDGASPPVEVRPEAVGRQAAALALAAGTGVVLVTEPRVGSDQARAANASRLLAGVRQGGAPVTAILPNLGAETPKLGDLAGKIVVAATGTGGVAYDAAVTAGAPAVVTGTVARTLKKKGAAPALAAARRAIAAARQHNTGICVVAASANSLEDLLAAEYIMKTIIQEGFLNQT
ncbi:hypothetical protein [Desulforamulus hydrothermalis]|uniref:2-phosphosulfolactate phosphatase n=1 Tax=Desulforamulus hydrothermalis Lam5 = DSM 18033 TaxID=1121428 RepID=K8E0H3_9FIRM|nr:hypothetical protein [Desulforamulus hydrothermalis]CCO08950.1 conserved hypothetical protein [Desulforamulus hydrothermalis Lam5 = DSM 18033]SHG75492.1 hypothetical protein SAMN02745177_00267 [Desulforamulus hydrothermalis Lam5 = DSM 18033]